MFELEYKFSNCSNHNVSLIIEPIHFDYSLNNDILIVKIIPLDNDVLLSKDISFTFQEGYIELSIGKIHVSYQLIVSSNGKVLDNFTHQKRKP